MDGTAFMAENTENHTIKLLQEMRQDMREFREEMRAFQSEVQSRFEAVDARFDEDQSRAVEPPVLFPAGFFDRMRPGERERLCGDHGHGCACC